MSETVQPGSGKPEPQRSPRRSYRIEDPLRPRESSSANTSELQVPAPQPTLLDKMLAGQLSPMAAAQAIMDEVYGPLKQFCSLPSGFDGRELAYDMRRVKDMDDHELDGLSVDPPSAIIDPQPPQIEAVELLKLYCAGHRLVCDANDPFKPRFGVNFVGRPGCGKTHIQMAFAHWMKKFLDDKLEDYHRKVAQFIKEEYGLFQTRMVGRKRQDEGLTRYIIGEVGEGELDVAKERDPVVQFTERLDKFKLVLSKLPYQPTDMLCLDFDALWELCRDDVQVRAQVLGAITNSKVVFIDDIHPKGDIERMQIVLHIIESRYAAGNMGTFITTNLATEDMVVGQDLAHINDRLQSRCSEMFYEVKFKDCRDWRTGVKHRRIELARNYLRQTFSLPDASADS